MNFVTSFKLILPVAFFGYAGIANLSLTQAEIARPDFVRFFDGKVTQEIDGIYRDNLPHREAAVGWIGAARYVLLNEGRSGVVSGRDGWLFSDEEFRSADIGSMGFLTTIDWVETVKAELQKHGSQLVVVPLASKVDIDRDRANAEKQSADMDAFYAFFIEELDRRGVSFVDTRSSLLSAGEAFFRTDTHWTSLGAETVAKAIAASGKIELGEQTFDQVYDEKVEFIGDLVSFVTSEELAPFVGLTPEFVHPYKAVDQQETGSLDLFGSSGPVPYALVGTSYSANENWSFAAALKLSLHHDVLNYAEQGQGPLAPMRAFLNRFDPLEAPETVIWEVPVRYLTDPDLMKQPIG